LLFNILKLGLCNIIPRKKEMEFSNL